MSVSRPLGAAYQAPASAEELYLRDKDYVFGLVRRHLGSDRLCDVEDAAADIMEKLILRNVIGMYRADVVSEHTHKTVTWRAFLSRHVMLRIRGKGEQVSRNRRREVLQLDAPVRPDGSSWGDIHAPGVTDSYPGLAEGDYDRLRNWLAMQPPAPGPLPLLDLFDELAERARSGEDIPQARWARKFGLDSAQAVEAMRLLQEALDALPTAPEPPRFAVGPVTLSVLQVKTALDALRAAKGNRVAPCLQAVRSPLGRLSTKEFITLGKAEARAYPEVKVPVGGHPAHTSQTKLAIMHQLERLLSGAGVTEPEAEEPPTTLEVLQAKLWHIPGLQTDQVDAILAAVTPFVAVA
jgi:hypothetical protein